MINYIHVALFAAGAFATLVAALMVLYTIAVYAHVEGYLGDLANGVNKRLRELIWSQDT